MNEQPQNTIFTVDDKFYCLWDWDLEEEVAAFLDGIDPDYFVYVADVHVQALGTDQQQHAALALRAAYAQALETFFAVLCAAIQAPLAVPAWLAKYLNKDLTSIVRKIDEGQSIYSAIGKKRLSWDDLSQLIHTSLVLEDKTKEITVKDGYGRLWERLADDFLNEENKLEYNSIKHGFRARSGGFSFAMGFEAEPGVPASPENMRVLGQSTFGSTFFVPEPAFNEKEYQHHLCLQRHMLNWHPNNAMAGLKLIAMSLQNILSCIKIDNGIADASDVKFTWPEDLEVFELPWKQYHRTSITNMTVKSSASINQYIRKATRDELKALYTAANDNLSSPSDTE